MSKNRKQLEESLNRVHNQLENAENLNDHTVELLQKIRDDIETLLGDHEGDADQSIRERVDKAVLQLDESHPELTSSLRKIMQVLSNMGI